MIEIEDAGDSCQLCKFHEKSNTVCMSGDGNEKSPDIMFIGEYPDYYSDKKDVPWAGDSRKIMEYYFDRCGIGGKWNNYFFSYALRCRVPFKKTPTGKQIKACAPYLIGEIMRVKPKLIMPMGKCAWQMLSGETSVMEFRGHFDQITVKNKIKVGGVEKLVDVNIPMLPTFSPQSAIGKWEYSNYIIHDIKKALTYLKTKTIPTTELCPYTVCLTKADLKQAYDIYMSAPVVTSDLETMGLMFHRHAPINVGYCDGNQAHIIYLRQYTKDDVSQKGKGKWSPEDVDYARRINSFLKDNSALITKVVRSINAGPAKKVGHNFKFDQKFMKYRGYPIKNFTHDTIIWDALNDENNFHNLNDCMERHGINFGAYDSHLWPYVNKNCEKPYSYVPPSILCKYLAIDVYGDFLLYKEQEQQINDEKNSKLKVLFERQQMKLSEELLRAEYRGMDIDVPLLKKYSEVLGGRLVKVQAEIEKLTGIEGFKPGSSKELSAYFEQHDYPFEKFDIKKGASGQFPVGKDTLAKFKRIKKYRKLPELLLDYRAYSKLKSTYVDGKDGDEGFLQLLDDKNRIHPSFNIFGPRTGRLSSQSPNGQNCPRPRNGINIRNLFKCPPGYVIWERDFSQLELRIISFMAKDQVMMQEFRDGVDLHSRNSIMFNETLDFFEQVTEEYFIKTRKTKKPFNYSGLSSEERHALDILLALAKEYEELRTVSKTVAFGKNYGLEDETIADQFDVSVGDVNAMSEMYFDKYHGIADFMEKMKEVAITRGVLVLPTGRKRRFTGFSNFINSVHGQSLWGNRRSKLIEKVGRQAINFPVQGFANEIYTKAKLKTFEELRRYKLRAYLGLSIHDGMVNYGHIDDIVAIKEISGKHFVSSLGKGDNYVPITSDFDVYTRWKGEKIDMEDYAMWRERIMSGTYKDVDTSLIVE